MKFKAVSRVTVPLAFAVSFGLYGAAQTTAASRPVTQSSADGASTLGASTSLSAPSNELANVYGTPVEQIVARVNDRVITNSDLTRAKSQLAEESRQNNWSLDEYNENEKHLLRDLIDQQLLLSKGKQLGITGDTELVKRLDDIRKQNHLESMDDLQKAVEQQGTSYEDFKANIRNSIITQEVVRDQVGSKIQISQQEVNRYYHEHQASFTQPESVHLKEILIPTPANATDSQLNAANDKAKKVWDELKGGGNFSDLAKKYSGGPTAQQGGDLGDFKRGALAKVLEDQTFDLPVGGYTSPIRTRQGYIILQVTQHIQGGTQPLQQVQPRIEQDIYMQQIEPAVRKYLTLLREQAYIDIRPEYTDAGASPNETKPTFEAYSPAQPKKKKKQQKGRYDHRTGSRTRMSARKERGPAIGAGAASGAASTSAASASTQQAKNAHFRKVNGKKQKEHKPKPVKFRYGQTPVPSVAQEQVATATPAVAPTANAATANAPQPAPGTGVQPLGPDLEHNPTVTQPKEKKTRFSDEAKYHQEVAAKRKREHKAPKPKKVKVDNARPTPLTSTEAENQQVQSAPLGLNGDTVHKKKHKKAAAKSGEKTRLSNQKKSKKKQTNTPAEQPPSSDGTSTPSGSGSPS